MTINANIPYIDMGWSFVLGLSIGYAVKKSFKFLLLLFGLGFIFIFFLENKKVLTTDELHLKELIESFLTSLNVWKDLLIERLGKYENGEISAMAGFIFGIKLG